MFGNIFGFTLDIHGVHQQRRSSFYIYFRLEVEVEVEVEVEAFFILPRVPLPAGKLREPGVK